MSANKDSELAGIKWSLNGLVQGVGDNFDQDISSQNGQIQTHSMALVLTQQEFGASVDEEHELKIPRLRKSEMGNEIPHQLAISRYTGPQKRDPPADSVKVRVMPLRFLARMVLAGDRAAEKYFSFWTDIVEKDDTPEFNGYSTRTTRSEDQSLQPKIRAVYLPLIDLPPEKCMIPCLNHHASGTCKEVNRSDRTDVYTFHRRSTTVQNCC